MISPFAMKRNWIAVVVIFCSLASVRAQPATNERFIFPLQDKHVHASSIIECPNGDLLACWYHGSGERTANDVMIQGARLRKGETKWGPVFIMADSPEHPDCNPVLFIDRKDRLFLFWVLVQANRWEASILKYRISTEYQNDGPPVWSWQDIIALKVGEEFYEATRQGFQELEPRDYVWAEYAPPYDRMIIAAAKDPIKRETGWMTRIHPTVLPTGRILLPLYSDGFCFSLVAISDDGGDTWRPSLPMVGRGNSQPSIVRKQDGTLVAFMRDDGDPPGRIMTSTSKDEGYTWTPATDGDLPNPGASVECLSLPDGRWVLVYNDTSEGRHTLAIALSDDEGASWKWKRKLEFSPTSNESYSYPSLIRTRDGLLNLMRENPSPTPPPATP